MLYRVLFIALLMLVGLAGVGRAQGPLVAYCPMPDVDCQKMIDGFTADTGIEVRFIRIPTGEIVARMRAEKGNSQADLWFGGTIDPFVQAASEGLLAPYKPKGIENIDPSLVPDKDGFWTPWAVATLMFVYNADLVKELGAAVPDSWESFADPAFRDNIVLAHPAASGTAYSALAAMVQIYGEDEAFRIMKEVDKNVVQYTRSGAAGMRMVATGETALALAFSGDIENTLSEGYSLEPASPKEGTLITMDSVALIAGARASHVEQAKAMVDWLITERGQQVAAATFRLPVAHDRQIPNSRIDYDSIKMIDHDFAWAGENRSRLLERYEREVRRGSEAK